MFNIQTLVDFFRCERIVFNPVAVSVRLPAFLGGVAELRSIVVTHRSTDGRGTEWRWPFGGRAVVAVLAAVLMWAPDSLGVPADSDRESIVVDGIAARVNKHVVTIGEVMAAMDAQRRRLVTEFAGEALETRLRQAYRETLDLLIDRYLVLDDYHASGARLPEWVVDGRIEEMIKEMFGNRSKLMDALAEERITFTDWRERMRDQMIVATMRRSTIDQKIVVPPEEVRRLYEARPEDYREPLRIHLRMVLIQPRSGEDAAATQARAAAVVERLAKGDALAAVAKDLSDDSKASDGGDWGWIEPSVLRGELADAAALLQPGQTSELLEIAGVLYVLKVEDRKESHIAPFDVAQPAIENKLRKERSEKEYREWMKRLRDKGYINISEINLFSAEAP